MQTIHDAFDAAATHIEQNPGRFYFGAYSVPCTSNNYGCALGWVGHFAGVAGGMPINTIAHALGVEENTFYNRMASCSSSRWNRDSKACARGLRAYADRYHSNKVPAEAIPAAVRALFSPAVKEEVA
jgi:hypothetical protein